MTSNNENSSPSVVITQVRDVDTHQARELAENGALLLDVREPNEWASGHIEGAIHMPLGDLNPASIPTHSPIVAVCRSGNRSSKAALELLKSGHDVVNMAGGMNAWHDAGLPTVDDRGEPGTV
ncbi:MAG: rhodanese-like domain-containing protein [Nocardioides sp.]|uniref:rhodanese-like domain-containing protein n=1 Tax=Nocardioides sp. TaxID=35761 RepID=UPI000C8C6B28|nr:rhodanese-like domain-containing protein [Nocardioides sp.]MAS55947.1 thiosulfate sulfurtransferase [Pimelobacter sp.]MDE0775492.1 rhodanese-like domain-containing protein [Nocardioides sp.]